MVCVQVLNQLQKKAETHTLGLGWSQELEQGIQEAQEIQEDKNNNYRYMIS
ncbi:hypothetical protein QJS04_geneDACA015073 [Acorus gramineus]|uniref:Uncharacterized protein n=1 Tax=Acorus gramineus TaxID=55184 RepID=A0AAV9BU10_ACOGR|nr:hypothetical protein QJS04_geneDACA015073 [Acorus gramineus]